MDTLTHHPTLPGGRDHGRPGRFQDRKNAIKYLQLDIGGSPRLLWAMPMPDFMLRGMFTAVDAGQIRWALPRIRTRTPARMMKEGMKPWAPLTF